jgi:hypothetical protein
VLVDFAKQRAAEPNRVVASLNNSKEQLENGTSLQVRDTAAAFRKEQAASRDVNASWQFPLATPPFATINSFVSPVVGSHPQGELNHRTLEKLRASAVYRLPLVA